MFLCKLDFWLLLLISKIAFSEDGSIPEAGVAVIENRALTRALLESIVGENGVSPAAKQSLALRLSEFMGKVNVQEKAQTEQQPALGWFREEVESLQVYAYVLFHVKENEP